ncbi:MAG: tetratricopeptide repeat protein [Rhodospirillales bacterium]
MAAIVSTAFVGTLSSARSADLSEGLEAARQGDYRAALNELLPAARAGDAEAQFLVGQIFRKGPEKFCAECAEPDDGHAVDQDYVEAAVWFRLAADQGHSEAQSKLAQLYRRGNGVRQDFDKAFMWYRRAADQGNPFAISDLAYMYWTGKGVTQDIGKAVELYMIGAKHGVVRAFTNLGFIYLRGEGIETNRIVSRMWFRAAGEAGSARALAELEKLDAEMSASEIVEADRLFESCKTRGYDNC